MAAIPRFQRIAFTLIELLVVVAIIAVLISILLPSLNQAREQAKTIKCLANLKTIGGVMHMYFTDNKDWFPFEKHNNFPSTLPLHGFYYGGHPGRQYDATDWWGYVRNSPPNVYRDTPGGRPFNRYMWPDLPKYDVLPTDPQFDKVRDMPVFECPSDKGGFWNSQTDDWESARTIYYGTGSSYDFNYHFCWNWGRSWPSWSDPRTNRWMHRGNAFLQRQLETAASRFIIFFEDPFDSAQWNYLPRRGWHGKINRHNFGFLDGHAAYTLADTTRGATSGDPSQGSSGQGWKSCAGNSATDPKAWWNNSNDPDYKYRDIAALPGN